MRTSPAVGGSRPVRIFSKVVLPQPEAPVIATQSPAAMRRCTSRSTQGSSSP